MRGPLLGRLHGTALRQMLAEVIFILAVPPVLFFAYAAVPISQANYLDPYIYTGYINNFSDLIERYGLTYYSVRFGFILPGLTLVTLLGPVAGHFALVSCFYLVAGVPLYLMLRTYWGVAGARIGYVTLVSSVWVASIFLSHYVASAAVAYLIGATALILRDPVRRGPVFFIVGILFGLVVHSSAMATPYVALAVIPYAVINAGRLRSRVALDVVGVLAGLVTVTLGGVLFYGVATGHWNMFAPTLRTIGAAGEIVAEFAPRELTWFRSAPWLWYPPFILATAALVLWRLVRSRVLLASVLYALSCSLFLLAWSRHGRGLANHFAFALLAGPLMPTACAIPAAIVAKASLARAHILLAILLVAGTPAAWIALDGVALAVDHVILAIAMGVALATIGRPPRSRLVAIAACVLFATASHLPFIAGIGRDAAATQAPPGYAKIFGIRTDDEWDTYRIALQLMSAMPRIVDDDRPLRFWYPMDPRRPDPGFRLSAIQGTYLWGYSRLQGTDVSRGAPDIGDVERAALAGPSMWLAVLGVDEDQLRQARVALDREGVRVTSVLTRSLCGGTRCLRLELLDLNAPMGYWLSGGADAPARRVFTADAPTLAQTLGRNLYGWSGKPRALTVSGDRLVFAPTSRTDHLTTAFFSLGERRGAETVGVRVTTRGPEHPRGRCRFLLQNQAFETLARVPCHERAGGRGGARVVELVLPTTVTSFRMVLVSADHRAVDLPSAVQIDLVTQPPSSPATAPRGQPHRRRTT